MSVFAYKFLARGAVGPVSGFRWPKPAAAGEPGAWVEAPEPALCARGVHACRLEELGHWLHEELWIIELDGALLEGIDCVVAARARLVREVAAWSGEGAARFARAARDHAAELAAAAPVALQPRLRQYIGDSSAHLPARSTALAAFCAAMAVGWLDGGDHFTDTGYRRERIWQARFIANDLALS